MKKVRVQVYSERNVEETGQVTAALPGVPQVSLQDSLCAGRGVSLEILVDRGLDLSASHFFGTADWLSRRFSRAHAAPLLHATHSPHT